MQVQLNNNNNNNDNNDKSKQIFSFALSTNFAVISGLDIVLFYDKAYVYYIFVDYVHVCIIVLK